MLAYIVYPFVVIIENKGLKRIYAVIILYIIFFAVMLAIGYYIIPIVYKESSSFIEALPLYIKKIKICIDRIYISFSKNLTQDIEKVLKKNIESYESIFLDQINSITQLFFAMFQGIIDWLLAIVISFYILKDKDYFINLIKYLIPINKRNGVNRVTNDINKVLTRFIRGQLLISLIIGILSTIGFLIIDLNFALFMRIITGLAEVIPYFGPIIGAVPVVIVGLMDNPNKAISAIIIIFIIQQLENGFIAPKIVGDSVGIHPIFIILALFIAGRFFGIIGMFFAVPITAILRIIILYIFNRIMYRTYLIR